VAALPAGFAMPRAPVSRIRELDALRGLAALAVVAFHYTTRFDELFGHAPGLSWRAPWGAAGVELFFILSGFVIFMTLDRTKSALDFVIGRFARLYPAYWTALAVTLAVVTCANLPGQQVAPWEAWLNVTMLQGLFRARHVDGTYWSLQAELLFYAAMLAMHRVGALRHLHATLALWLAAAFVAEGCATGRIATGGWGGESVSAAATKMQTLLSLKYIHLFAIGMLLYDARRRGARAAEASRRRKWEAGALAASCLTYRAVFDSWEGAGLVVAMAALVAAAVAPGLAWLRRPLAARPLVFLGTISYSLYLIHQNVGYVVLLELEAAGISPNLAVMAAGALALAAAALLTRAVEQPTMNAVRKLKERGWPRRAWSPRPSRMQPEN
jgi:peptidoglycan/LPS O-acetylase OafA/YrhL